MVGKVPQSAVTLKGGVRLSEQLCDVDVNNPPQGPGASSLAAHHHRAPGPLVWLLTSH